MNRDDGSLVQLLIDTGLLSVEEAKNFHAQQIGAVLKLMLSKKALRYTEMNRARELLGAVVAANQTRRLKAKMELVNLITGNLHRRMTDAGNRVAAHKKRITTNNFHVVPVKLNNVEG